MRTTKHVAVLITLTFFFVLTNAIATSAQNNKANVRQVAYEQKLKIQGIVIKRNADSFRVRDNKTVDTDVVLTPATEVRTHLKTSSRMSP